MKTEDNWFDKLLLNKWFYMITTAVFIIVLTYVFKWNHKIYIRDIRYIVDNDLLGTYGDFFGGVLGTIFAMISILILIKTFNSQRAITERNEQQIENQRFNDLFFELLNLYKSEVSELCVNGEAEDGETAIHYTDKDFFDFKKEQMQKTFLYTKSYDKNRAEALDLYMRFYVENREKMAACFRTLYRMYDLLDESGLKESVKKNYLKIIRAQLTDSELFFLRYNGMSYYGANFVYYMNKYNVLKHLPAFELLEFKDWWKDLTKVERMGMNIVFYKSTRVIRRLLSIGKNISFDVLKQSDKYKFVINTDGSKRTEIVLKILKHQKNNVREYVAFDKFNNKKIQALLDCYLKELFLYSNFCRFNVESNLRFFSDQIKDRGDAYIINSGVENIKGDSLFLFELFN